MITMIKYNKNRSFKRTLSQFSHNNVFYYYAFVKLFVASANVKEFSDLKRRLAWF